MRMALNTLMRELEWRMQAQGMTGVQMLPLLAIHRGLCCTGADLARLTNTDPGAMTRMLDRLEGKGLLRRVRSEADRRVVSLELTAEGRAIAERIPYALADTLNFLLREFSADELERFKDFLRRLATAGSKPDSAVEALRTARVET